MNIKFSLAVVMFFTVIFSLGLTESLADEYGDKHYSKEGFFDIHVCNWPNRPPFFMVLYSTEKFSDLVSVSIYDTNNHKLGNLNLTKFRLIKQKNKPEKKVFISQFDIPKNAKNGVYTSKAVFKTSGTVKNSDFVVINKLPIAKAKFPANNSNLKSIPEKLSWHPVIGAQYYQVFVRDIWGDNTVTSSKLITKPYISTKEFNLQSGGVYQWKIHSRDVNEHILFGDFNHGSLSSDFEFTIQD